MISFLLSVLFIYILVKTFLFFYKINKTTKHYRKQYEDMMGGFGRQSGGSQQSGRQQQSGSANSHQKTQDPKRYSSKDGEYVDFVEIKGERPQQEECANNDRNSNYNNEDYITDVKFEEIIDK